MFVRYKVNHLVVEGKSIMSYYRCYYCCYILIQSLSFYQIKIIDVVKLSHLSKTDNRIYFQRYFSDISKEIVTYSKHWYELLIGN